MSWSTTFHGRPEDCKQHFAADTSRKAALASKEEEAVRDCAFVLIDAAIEKNVEAKSLAISAYGSQNSRFNGTDKTTSMSQDVMINIKATL